MSNKNRIIQSLVQLLITIAVISLVGFLSSLWYFRIDLTSEKRYSLSDATKTILDDLPGEIEIEVYLDGDLPVGFRKLRTSVLEMLEELRIYSDRKIKYEFINPSEEKDKNKRLQIQESLVSKGLKASNAQWRDKEGSMSQKIIFPGAVIRYGEAEFPVNFLRNNPGLSGYENLNNSAEGLEYELVNAIHTITSDSILKIAFLEGHGEYFEAELADASRALSYYYTIDRGKPGGRYGILDNYAAIIIARPVERFSEKDKLVLDQYLMNGGRILWLLEPVAVDKDSLMYSSFATAYYYGLNLNDILFTWGVRIETNLIQDMQCSYIPVNTALAGNPPQYTPLPWLYFPLLSGYGHSITRNLNLVRSEFASKLDTVRGQGSIKKTFLLHTSVNSRIMGVPALINLRDAGRAIDEKMFRAGEIDVAVLLEGEFVSPFKNRMISEILPEVGSNYRKKSLPTKMIVVSDADIIRNGIRMEGGKVYPLELGRDRLTQELYGNKDFIVNAINYLVDDSGLMELRTRKMRIRLLDRAKINKSRLLWQLINIIVPVLMIVIAGLIFSFMRKRRYGR